MSPEDTAHCQQAINLANTGQIEMAYARFYALRNNGNPEDVTLLYWIAYTTPFLQEAEQAIMTIARLEPMHPKLQELQAYVRRKHMGSSPARQGPLLQCPYCHSVRPARIKQKISVGGWVWFAAFFLFALCCWMAIVPITQTQTMGCTGFFFLLLSIIGFFFKKRSYTCGSCGIALGDI